MKIQYTRENENGKADALSRRPDHIVNIPKDSGAILKVEDDEIAVNYTLRLTAYKIEHILGTQIREGYEHDSVAKRILQQPDNLPPNFEIEEEYLLFKELYYVPDHKDLREQVIKEYHDTPTHGHMGIERTYSSIAANYYWPQMRQQIEKYIKTCDSCLRNKPSRHKPYGQLQPIPPPDTPWKIISWD